MSYRPGLDKWSTRLQVGFLRRLLGPLSYVITTIGLLAIVVSTTLPINSFDVRLCVGIVAIVWGCIVVEFAFRMRSAFVSPRGQADFSPAEILIDLASTIVPPIGWLLADSPEDASLFGVVWTLRYIRNSTGLPLFWRIIVRSRTALLSIASLFLVVFVGTAMLAYIFERGTQPEAFGSIPRAMWWSIVTLTTTGYGDLVPTTIWGQLLSGWVMVGGLVTFALQAGIIATAFSEELKRRHFIHTWDLVISVSFFQGLSAAAVADIVRRLQTRDVEAGTVIVRKGEPGEAMYFIVSGEVSVQLAPDSVLLGPGDFFGEMALLFSAPRSATVVATEPTVLLVLDIADFRELAGRRPEVINAIETQGEKRRQENAAMAHD